MARILVVTVTHPPEDARILPRQIRALREYGHHVTYAAPFAAFNTPRPPLPTHNLPHSRGNVFRRIPAMWAAARLVLHERANHDLVLAHDPELFAALAAARLPSRKPRPAAVWDVHEDVPAQVHMLHLPRPVRATLAGLIHASELVAERLFQLILAETSYQDRFRRPHPVVPNSVRLASGGPWPATSNPRVVYLGALTWSRGAREIIALAEAVPEVTFEVIGHAKGDVVRAITDAAARLPNLTYHGFVPNDAALAMLPGALAGLSLLHEQPNYAHSEPTKVMEYMAHSVPAITTPNPASRDLVAAADCGIVVDFGDIAAAARAVRHLNECRGEQARLAANAYRAASQHDWGRDGHEFAALLERWARGG